MSSSKRAEANRRNSQKSTGPTSRAGKEKSRFNALKHGMRAKLPLLPDEDGDAFRARLDSWTDSLQPRDDLERYLVERAVNVSWQIDRADRAWAARLEADLLASGSSRSIAQADEALDLGRRLFWDPRGPVELYPQFAKSYGPTTRVSWSDKIEDPDEPARLLNRLEGTAMGCAWLLDRWNELGDLLEGGLTWQAPDRFKATRLLGKQPLAPIDDLDVRWIHLCTSAMDPKGPKEFGDIDTDLHDNERERFLERLRGRDAWREKPKDAETARAGLLELISEQTGRLEQLLASHLERESAASAGELGFQDTQAVERLRRYQMACDRTLLRILETLRKRHREADGAKEGSKRGRKTTEAASGVESPSEGDLLRQTSGPLVAEVQEPLLRPADAVPTDGLVERGSPEPALSPIAGLPIPEDATNEANGPLNSPPSPTADRPIQENATNEANGPTRTAPRTLQLLSAIVLALLTLLFGAGLIPAFGASREAPTPQSSPRSPAAGWSMAIEQGSARLRGSPTPGR